MQFVTSVISNGCKYMPAHCCCAAKGMSYLATDVSCLYEILFNMYHNENQWIQLLQKL